MSGRKATYVLVSAALVVTGVAILILSHRQVVDTKQMNARAGITFIGQLLNQYHKDTGKYPTTGEGLDLLSKAGYVRQVPRDPWDNPYLYRNPGLHQDVPYDLWSFGHDGRAGGTGEDADITNWSRSR